MSRVRPDVKILTNFLLADIPELHEHCIFVDPFGSRTIDSLESARPAPRVSLAARRRHVGDVSLGRGLSLRFAAYGDCRSGVESRRGALDPADRGGCSARFFQGRNSVPFQAMGLLHPGCAPLGCSTNFSVRRARKSKSRGHINPCPGRTRSRQRPRSCRLFALANLSAGAAREPATHLHPPCIRCCLQRKRAQSPKQVTEALLSRRIAAFRSRATPGRKPRVRGLPGHGARNSPFHGRTGTAA